MAVVYPTYPVTTLAQAEDMIVFTGNQIHDIMNADATSVIEAEDGAIPSIRKALVDNMYFKTPQDWVSGTQVIDPLQLKQFTDGGWYFAPTATVSTPVSLGTTPIGDTNWKPWNKDQAAVYQHAKRLAAEAGLNMVSGSFYFGGALDSIDDVLFYEGDGKYYSWSGSFGENGKVVAAGSSPIPVSAGNWVDRTEDRLRSDINIVTKKFSNVAQMKAAIQLGDEGKLVEWVSYYDGWAIYLDKPKGGNSGVVVAAGTGVADDGSLFDTPSGLQVKALFEGRITNPYQFGAKSDGVSDDWQPLQNQANYCYNSGYLMDLLSGNYRLSATLDFVANQPVNSNFEMPYGIVSDGRTCVFTYTGTSGTALSLVSTSYQKNINNGIIKGGFKIVNAGTGEIGFHFLGINNWEIENLHVSGFSGKQILLESNSGKAGLWNRFENTYVYGGNYGLYVGETANANTFDRIFAGGCAIDQVYTQGDRTQIYSLSIDDGGDVCRSGIFCAGTTTIFGVEIEMGGTAGNANFLGAIYGDGSAKDYLTVYNFTAVGVTPRYAWNGDMNVVIYPSRSSTSTGNGLEIIASGDIKAPNIRLQPRMRVITNTLVSGVSSTYSTYQSLWNGGYGDFTIDAKTVKIVNNTDVSLDFQIRYMDTSGTLSTESLLKFGISAGATLTLTTEEINQLMKGFTGDVILKALVARVRTASASYTGTINGTVTGLQF